MVALRAFPVLYARDVEGVAGLYERLGFIEHARLPGPDGGAGFISLRRDAAELTVTIEDPPRMLARVEPGPRPRHELFAYVEDVDATVAAPRERSERVVREPVDMPWGERVAFAADPEGNRVSLASAPAASG